LEGALATLFSYRFARYVHNSSDFSDVTVKINCVSIAAPHVGDSTFQSVFQELESQGKIVYTRVTTSEDTVPRLLDVTGPITDRAIEIMTMAALPVAGVANAIYLLDIVDAIMGSIAATSADVKSATICMLGASVILSTGILSVVRNVFHTFMKNINVRDHYTQFGKHIVLNSNVGCVKANSISVYLQLIEAEICRMNHFQNHTNITLSAYEEYKLELAGVQESCNLAVHPTKFRDNESKWVIVHKSPESQFETEDAWQFIRVDGGCYEIRQNEWKLAAHSFRKKCLTHQNRYWDKKNSKFTFAMVHEDSEKTCTKWKITKHINGTYEIIHCDDCIELDDWKLSAVMANDEWTWQWVGIGKETSSCWKITQIISSNQ